MANCAKTQNLKFSFEISARKYLHFIDSSKHSKHYQIKIDKVNHCNFNDLKKIFIALVDCFNYQNWTSTSRSKYVSLKIMDEITYPLTIEVWELPLENFITHFNIYDGCSYLSMLGFKGNPC